jgi:hypothetical protein
MANEQLTLDAIAKVMTCHDEEKEEKDHATRERVISRKTWSDD